MKKVAYLFSMVGLCLLQVGCGSVLRRGFCDAQGNLAYGAEPLHVQNLEEVKRLVTDKPFDHLDELRDYLGVNAMGKSRTEASARYNPIRYDAWVYCTMNRQTLNKDDFYLLVESESGKVLRLAYAAMLDEGVWTAGDSGLVNAMIAGMSNNDRSLPSRAFVGAATRANKVAQAYSQYVRQGGDATLFYKPAPYRRVTMPPPSQPRVQVAPVKKKTSPEPKRVTKPEPKPEPEVKPDYRSEVLKHLN